jgi:hypothetical protein
VQPSPRWTTTPCHRVRKPSTAKGCESHFRAKTRRRIRLPSNWHFQNPGWTVYGCFLNVLTRLRGPKAREHLLAVRPKTRVVSRAESPRIGENAAPTHQSQPIFTTNPPQEGFWAPFFRFPCRYARSNPIAVVRQLFSRALRSYADNGCERPDASSEPSPAPATGRNPIRPSCETATEPADSIRPSADLNPP